ncbi:MAG: DUF6580 family putative transport protein [Hyphomicrobiales bacterium]
MFSESRLTPAAITAAAIFLLVLGVGGRLLPHAPNFTPLVAVAVFGAFLFRGHMAAWIVPVAVLLLSNLVLGFYEPGVVGAVIAGTLLAVAIGRFSFRNGASLFSVGAASLGGALGFFLLSNLGVWAFGAGGHAYPHTVEGLAACFTAALPFFKNLLAGTVFWSVVLFGCHALARRIAPEAFGSRPV